MAEQSTSLTSSVSTRSNVPYQLQLFYNVTKRTATEVVMDIDVHVHYPNEWSSNGAWVMIDGARKNLNPNHTRGSWDWYASSQGTSRSVGDYWMKGKRFSASVARTSINISVGFSNYQWAAGEYHFQPIAVPIPGYKEKTVGEVKAPTADVVRSKTTIPNEPVSVYSPDYFVGDLPISWSEAPQADRYKIQLQKWGTKGAWIDSYSFSVLGSTHSIKATLNLQSPGEIYRAWIVPLYQNPDGTHTEGVHSRGPNAIVNTLPNPVTPSQDYSRVTANDDFKLNVASDPDRNQLPGYHLKIENIDNGRTVELGRQLRSKFTTPFKDMNGERLNVYWKASDRLQVPEQWSGPVRVDVGKVYSQQGNIKTNRNVFERNFSITIPPLLADGQLLDHATEIITIEYNITKDRASAAIISDSVEFTRSGPRTIKLSFIYSELWDTVINKYPQLLSDDTFDNAKVDITIVQKTSSATITTPIATIRNKIPKAISVMTPIKKVQYGLDSSLPIIFDGANISLNGSDYNSNSKGYVTIFMEDSATGESTQLHRFSISGSRYDLDYYIDIAGAGCKPGNTYKLFAEVRLTNPTNYFERIDLVLPNGSATFTTPQPIEVELETLSARTSFIENNLDANEVIINYNLKWNNARAFQITKARIIGTDENGLIQYIGEVNTPVQLFSKTSSEQNFRASMLLGDIEVGDKWTIQSAEVMSQTATRTDSGLGMIRENTFDFKLDVELTIREIYRTTSTAAEPDPNLLSDSVKILTKTYWCDTHELPYYMTTGIGFKRV